MCGLWTCCQINCVQRTLDAKCSLKSDMNWLIIMTIIPVQTARGHTLATIKCWPFIRLLKQNTRNGMAKVPLDIVQNGTIPKSVRSVVVSTASICISKALTAQSLSKYTLSSIVYWLSAAFATRTSVDANAVHSFLPVYLMIMQYTSSSVESIPQKVSK